MSPNGMFWLNDVGKMYDKACVDFARMQMCRTEQDYLYACYDFVMTAHHLADWHKEGNLKAASEFRRKYAVLRVCEHLAIGGKHFYVADNNVKDKIRGTHAMHFTSVGFQDSANVGMSEGCVGLEFYMDLDGTEGAELGVRIGARQLAKMVIDLWAGLLGRQECRGTGGQG
jgi:hypothetical protein